MKNINLKKILFTAFLFLGGYAVGNILSSALFAQKPDNGILWEVGGNGLESKSYLFGTYHLLNSDYLENWPVVGEKFAEAEALVVEAVIDSALLPKLSGLAIMKDASLTDFYTPEEYQLIAREFEEEMGYSLKMMDTFYPSAVSAGLIVLYTLQLVPEAAKVGGMPLDLYFAHEAESQERSVNQLESMEWQLRFLYQGEKPEKQARELLDLVKEEESMRELGKDLIQAYLDRDLDAMTDVVSRSEEYFDLGDELIKGRNLRWMKVLPDWMQKESQFVAVGALHLAGPYGLVQLLREAGYTVKAIY